MPVVVVSNVGVVVVSNVGVVVFRLALTLILAPPLGISGMGQVSPTVLSMDSILVRVMDPARVRNPLDRASTRCSMSSTRSSRGKERLEDGWLRFS